MKRKAFTLIELLVTITIIGILAAMVLGALQGARQTAREYATKATIAKLNNIIMQRYESYMTRRVGFDRTGMTPAQIQAADDAARANPRVAARYRLDAIRDLMRMEMPDARSDVVNGSITFSWGHIPEPALHRLYAANPPTADHDSAQCLYMLVSMGSPDAMEQFHQSEIGTVDGKPVFIDGWGTPIMWLRWAPGFRSPIQSGDQEKDHDPFDSRKIDGFAFHMVPLIYSGRGRKGVDGTPQYGIELGTGAFNGNPYQNMDLGKPQANGGSEGNITNHLIEQR